MRTKPADHTIRASPMLAALAAALAIAAVLALPAAAPAASTSSGGLSAELATGHGRLRIDGRAGRTVLESPHGVRAAALAFRAAGRWQRATRVRSARRVGRRLIATIATDDPARRRLRLTIAPVAAGVLALHASVLAPRLRRAATPLAPAPSAIRIAFSARPGERFLGFGERSDAVDQRGRDVLSYVADGPYLRADDQIVRHVIPPAGFLPRPDASYFPIPWLLSTRGYGVLVTNDEPSAFDLAHDRRDAWTVTVSAPSLGLELYAGPRPAGAVRRFTRRHGRQPPPAAPFVLGPWVQPPPDISDAAMIAALRDADAPASVAQTYTHYLPCGAQVGARAQQRRRTAGYHRAGLAVTTYFNPMICRDYEPVYSRAARARVLTTDRRGAPYVYDYFTSQPFAVSQIDFSAPRATRFLGRLLREAIADGYDGWMEDFGEYTPLDSRSRDGRPASAEHNRYPALYHRAAHAVARRASRPILRFNRSGWTGAARDSQVVWGGDPSTDWGFDGLRSALDQGLTIGLSGVSLWGSDIGGYFTISAPQLTPELLARWIELGAASGVMRTQAGGLAIGPKGRRPQILDPDVLPIWRRYAKLRTQLYPYLAAAQRAYRRSGMPLMRQLALVRPRDRRAAGRDDEYMLGGDLLVAPVLRAGARTRRVYLPRGHWVDAWSALRYRPRDGSLQLAGGRGRVRRPRALRGRRTITVGAALDELPLLVRAGAVLALLPADVDTLTSYGRARGLVHLHDRARARTLIAFPRGRSRSAIGPGERVLSRERRRRAGWTLAIDGRRRRRYSLQASLATLRRPFRPCRLELDGRPLRRSSWSFDARTGALRARFRARDARLTALACGRRRGRPAQPAAAALAPGAAIRRSSRPSARSTASSIAS